MSRTIVGPFIGALLRHAWRGVREHIENAVRQAGYDDVSRAHIGLFRHPTLDGARPTELAEEMRVSKQGVNDLLQDLERQGYIRRVINPADKRSRLIRLTPKGEKLEDAVRRAAEDAERILERKLGKRWLQSLREALRDTAHALEDTVDAGGKS